MIWHLRFSKSRPCYKGATFVGLLDHWFVNHFVSFSLSPLLYSASLGRANQQAHWIGTCESQTEFLEEFALFQVQSLVFFCHKWDVIIQLFVYVVSFVTINRVFQIVLSLISQYRIVSASLSVQRIKYWECLAWTDTSTERKKKKRTAHHYLTRLFSIFDLVWKYLSYKKTKKKREKKRRRKI